MKKKSITTLLASFLILSFLTPSFAQTAWREKMQGLYALLISLTTQASSESFFSDPKNHDAIEADLKKFSNLSHTLKDKKIQSSQSDPTLSILAHYLTDETRDALEAFKGGRTSEARSTLLTVTSTCIACHSRSANGPQFQDLAFEPKGLSLNLLEQAKFYSASRQFDKGISTYLQVLETKGSSFSEWDAQEAVKEALNLAVRVKKDPKLALQVIEKANKSEKSSYSMSTDLDAWKTSLISWQNEKAKDFKTEASLFSEGQRIFSLAKKAQSYPMDRAADMIYLRTSAVFYDFLQQYPNSIHSSEAFFTLGMCQEILHPRHFEDLDRLYYEACIQKSPHTKIAMACYKQYEQSLYFSNTGSSGVHLPNEAKKKLLELFSIAMPIKN